MRILVTNDDGIHAAGLAALVHALTALGHTVAVIAPVQNRSGSGQAVTVDRALTVSPEPSTFPDVPAFAVDGTPADCIRVAPAVLPWRPDLVMSGINHGPNLGSDVYRSGTVGAAREAVLAGTPSVALSALASPPPPAVLRLHIPVLIREALEQPDHVVNVNFPVQPTHERIRVPVAWDGYRETAAVTAYGLGDTAHVHIQRRIAPAGSGDGADDIGAALQGYVTVSLLPVAVRAVESWTGRLEA
jgi:5'-nucleotidase